MKKFTLVTLITLMCFFTLKAQIKMDCDGDVAIGYMSTDPVYQLEVRGNAYIACLPANSGFYFTNYSTAPIIKPQWNCSAYLGEYSSKYWRTYTYNLHYNCLYQLSDLGLKENIRAIESPLSTITKIRGVVYDFKQEHYKDSPEDKMEMLIEEGKNNLGVIAQELKEVVPELVKFNEESELFEVNYIGIIPILVEAIKEQQLIIENLQYEILTIKKSLANDGLKSASLGEIESTDELTTNTLHQNSPNPFNENTKIEFYLTEETQNAILNVYDMNGTQLKSIVIDQIGFGNVTLSSMEYNAGMYMYALIADGIIVDTKQMILTD